MAIESIVEKLVIPKIGDFTKWCKGKYKEHLIPKAEHFQEYLNRTYEKYSIINTLVFHNSQRQLKDIYVAQSLISKYFVRSIKIDKLPVELIKKYNKILITDAAGMGKSTMMKRMFIDLIDRGMEEVGIPIYIELNRLKKGRTILMEIREELSSLSKEFERDLYLKLIQTGGFIFFLDGYDEISITNRSEVTEDIQDFIKKAGTNNNYIMTSRPESGLLSSFGDFQLFSIQPLEREEAFELLRRYDLSKKKELSEKLIELLESRQYYSIREFLENPLLVSLLFTAYDYNQSIPFEKHRFYEIVFEAYFEKHDNTKPLKQREKHSGLNCDGFDRILRYVGYDCLIKTGVKFNKDTILNSIRKAKNFFGYIGDKGFSENDFLEDLVSTVPLFCKESSEYKWLHKSLLEYFAARFIFYDAKAHQDKILTAIYQSESIEKYLNMLDIYYDIDLKGFSKNITLPFCEEFIQFYDNSKLPSNVSKDLIAERFSGLFVCKAGFSILTSYEKSDLLRPSPTFNIGFSFSIMQLYYERVCYYYDYSSSNNYHLFKLLKSKKISVISIDFDYRAYSRLLKVGLPPEISKFERNKFHFIDTETGCLNKKLYFSINLMLLHSINAKLDYEACKKEVERIKKEIASEEATDLLAGI